MMPVTLPSKVITTKAAIIGYNCPVQTITPNRSSMSHCTIRGVGCTITLGAYRLYNSCFPDDNPTSTIFYAEANQPFKEVLKCQYIAPDNEEKLLKRLKTVLLFS